MKAYNTNFKEKLDYLKAVVDLRYLVESLGFVLDKDGTKELRGPCKIHNGDNVTSFRVNLDTRTWVCFSHKCHEQYGYDIIGLIRAALNIDFMAAVEYLENLTGDIGDYKTALAEYKRRKDDEAFSNEYGFTTSAPDYVNEDSLERHKHFRSNMFLDDGFSKETLDYFDIAGGHTDGHGIVRDIIPIRSVYGDLVAFSLRDIRNNTTKKEEDFKYLLTKNFNKDTVLYNLDRVKKEKGKPIIVVEGFKSVWRLHQYGITNVVAVMGSKLTPGQINLLCSYALNGIVLMFDNDVAGITGALSSIKSVKEYINNWSLVFITETDEKGKGLDPSDLSKESIYKYLKNYF